MSERLSVRMCVLLATAVIHSTINNHFDFPLSVKQIDFLVHQYCSYTPIASKETPAVGVQNTAAGALI